MEPYASQYLEPSKRYRRFSLLLCIKKNPGITQKQLGEKNSLSSSMVNNYIKQLTADGLLSVSGNSNRSMTYHLTAKGTDYVSQNFLSFSAEIVQFYAAVKREIIEMLEEDYKEGIRTVVLYGASDTAEIVFSAIQNTELTITGVVDNDKEKRGTLFFGQVIKPPSTINKIRPDALIVTSFARQNEILDTLENQIDPGIRIKLISRI